MAVETTVTTITPEEAGKLLEGNKGNRPLRPSAINRYAKDMKEGRWILNGEAIMVAEDGTLINGQNRLSAVVLSGTPIQTVLVTGLNGSAMDTIDLGVGRTLSDALHWKDVKNSRSVATALTWVYRYDDMVERGVRQFPPAGYTRSDLLKHMEDNPGLVESVAYIEKLRKRLPVSVGIAAFVHYLITRHASRAKANEFWTQVSEPGGDDSNMAYLLREWLLDHQTLMTRKSPVWTAAMAIKAARFWVQGVEVKRLAWKRTGQRKGEEFPRIDTALV